MEPVRRPYVPSKRSLEVARARCATGSRKDAATLLGISIHTVRKHMTVLRIGLALIDDSQVCYALAHELKTLP